MLKKIMFADIIEKLFFRKKHIFPIVLCKFYVSIFSIFDIFSSFWSEKSENKNEEDERLVKYPNLAFRFVDATTKISWAKSLHCQSRSKKVFLKFWQIHRKTIVLESPF